MPGSGWGTICISQNKKFNNKKKRHAQAWRSSKATKDNKSICLDDLGLRGIVTACRDEGGSRKEFKDMFCVTTFLFSPAKNYQESRIYEPNIILRFGSASRNDCNLHVLAHPADRHLFHFDSSHKEE